MKNGIADFYFGKNVFVTGHTGFKGTWISKMLLLFGAHVTGYSLEAPTPRGRKFFEKTVKEHVASNVGDIRNLENLKKAFSVANPDVVVHLAAQPLVLESYIRPAYTYDVNVMGTVNLLECLRLSETVRSCVIVTTDKVYENKEWVWGYRENDALNGKDPYSNSKSCAELIVSSYQQSFFREKSIAVSTVRAGNVIGGGDFAENRIIPDCVRAALAGKKIYVRHPYSVRPYQHVLEALSAYLMVAARQWEDQSLAGSYNVGPDETDILTTGELVQMFCEMWGNGLTWLSEADTGCGPMEAKLLSLDCSKVKKIFGWKPHWNIKTAIKKTIEWYKDYGQEHDLAALTERQITEFWDEKRCEN